MVTTTHCFLLARAPISTMAFSAQTGATSMYLNGPGGESGDGFPLPRAGVLRSLSVFDGSQIHSDFADVSFGAGARLSVYCQSMGSNFTARVRINGASAGINVPDIPFNSSVKAVVEFALSRE